MTTAYDPYGQTTAKTGDQSHVGFQGDWTDPDTGQVNMGARWYEPGTGTFTCVERFAGSLGGRSGSFALTASGFTDDAHVVHGRWEVVPGSATGELTGLRGYAAFFAKQVPGGPTGWAARDVLTYWFEAGRAA